jgi:DNA-binding transcriptional regulator YdaS (Cro superfamily)
MGGAERVSKKIAALAGMNPSLIRQFAAGIKYPSREQVEKIERALQ